MYAVMDVFELFNRLAALDSARSHVSIETGFALLDSVGVTCEIDVSNIQCNVVSLNTNAFLFKLKLLTNIM